MTTSNENGTSSSKNSGKLRLDFYESAVGETIIITFPSGGLGIVDAHPSHHARRPTITQLVAGKHIHFVCLSHPHLDHGVDLIPVVQSHPNIDSFWDSVSDVESFYWGLETNNYHSPVQKAAHEFRKSWPVFLIELYFAFLSRDIPHRQLHSNVRPFSIDGVDIYVLSPDESIKNRFVKAYAEKAAGRAKAMPNTNLLSIVLAIKYGGSVVLLGSDALKYDWENVARQYRENGLPKAVVLKVPHHGASDAIVLHPQRGESNYLNFCSRLPQAKAVLFAGDAKHPDADVYQAIRASTDVMCLSNGVVGRTAVPNPLGIGIPGARAVTAARICNPVISFELDEKGNVNTLAGMGCGTCGA